jgi:hypothetical protein
VFAALEANYKVWNSRVTGRGLISNLEKYPTHVHLIEGAESMYRDPRAVGVLRSALDGQRQEADWPVERWVTWSGDSAARKPKEVFFPGGIITLSNPELPSHKPEVQALKTRLKSPRLAVTDEELRALMRGDSAKRVGLNGYAMTPGQCGEVRACVEEELHAMRSPLSMRLLVDNGFPAFVQHAMGNNGAAERAIRPLAIGRGNWLHVGGDGGLKTASVLLSVCASATRHRLNPWSYLRDVLDQLAARSAGGDVGDLLAASWASRHAPTP